MTTPRRLLPHPWLTLVLTLLWLLLSNSLAPGHILLGLALSNALVALASALFA